MCAFTYRAPTPLYKDGWNALLHCGVDMPIYFLGDDSGGEACSFDVVREDEGGIAPAKCIYLIP